jgi:hypothetical protein
LILDGDFCIFWEGLLRIWTFVQKENHYQGLEERLMKQKKKKREIRGKHRTVEKEKTERGCCKVVNGTIQV